MSRVVRKIVLVCVCVGALAACAPTNYYRSDKMVPTQGRSVVLMPLDLELGELQAGGVVEPKAEWTDTGRRLMTQAIDRALQARNAKLVTASRDPQLDRPDDPEVQLVKLHTAVGGAVLIHHLAPQFRLPSKAGAFDWTLGPDVKELGTRYNADYALFVYMRDNYTSAGRVAVILVAAAMGAAVPGGHQIGYASLVDLRSGDIVWVNFLARQAGDLRKEDGATETVNALLREFPK